MTCTMTKTTISAHTNLIPCGTWVWLGRRTSPLVQRCRAQYKTTGPSTIPRGASATFTYVIRVVVVFAYQFATCGSPSDCHESSSETATYPVSPHFYIRLHFVAYRSRECFVRPQELALLYFPVSRYTSDQLQRWTESGKMSKQFMAHLILALRAKNWIFRAPFSSTQNDDSTTPSGVFIEGVVCDWFRKSFGRGMPSPESPPTNQRTAHAYNRTSRSKASNCGSLLGR
jgi:hypothetical protein